MNFPVDIDELERMHAAATPAQHDGGDWFVDLDRNDQPNILAGNHDHWVALLPHQCVRSLEVLANVRASYIAAMHNAMPSIIAELKALRKVAEVAQAAVDLVDEENERDALRRVLSEVPK